MLIDDDDVTLLICELRLKASKFCEEIIKMDDGADALAFFENQLTLAPNERTLPELIFLDINMPITNGWEFLDEFEKKYQSTFGNIPIAVLSSTIDPVDTDRAANHELVLGFISKPLTEASLVRLGKSGIF